MTKIKDIIHSLEELAPLSYAESYDNVGLIVGDKNETAKGVLVSLDCTEEVVDDAILKGCNLIVSHHPIVFKGLKRFNGSNYVERTVIKAIKNDISLYAIHTNLDSVTGGVNFKIAEKIGLENTKILNPKSQTIQKLEYYVPVEAEDAVRDAIFRAGAGKIGNYSNCSFRSNGLGTFLPGPDADPHLGVSGSLEELNEVKVEIVFPAYLKSTILRSLFDAHPYEEVAHYVHGLDNSNQYVGSGLYGELKVESALDEFLADLKQKMELSVIRHTKSHGGTIKRVAVCGGSGSFLLGSAKAVGADIFITSDFKYHEFFDAEGDIVIADIGHYESERFTVDLLAAHIRKNFSTFATHFTDVNTNPIHYY